MHYIEESGSFLLQVRTTLTPHTFFRLGPTHNQHPTPSQNDESVAAELHGLEDVRVEGWNVEEGKSWIRCLCVSLSPSGGLAMIGQVLKSRS